MVKIKDDENLSDAQKAAIDEAPHPAKYIRQGAAEN